MAEKNNNAYLQCDKLWSKAGFSRFVHVFTVILLGMGTILALGLVAQQTVKDRFINEVTRAVAQGQIHIFTKNTDWNHLRSELKADLKQRATYNLSLPQNEAVLENVVDYYVRPENMPDLLHYYKKHAAHLQIRDFIRRIYFSGLTEMTIEIAPPPQLDKPWLNRQAPMRAVLRLQGTRWVLKELDAPDYLIPSRTPKAAVTKHVMRKAA